LLLPADNAKVTTLTPLLKWSKSNLPAGTTFDKYGLQIALNKSFTSLVSTLEVNGIANIQTTTPELQYATTYYWRLRAINSAGEYSSWSAMRSFRTPLPIPTNLHQDGLVNNLRPHLGWDMPIYPPPLAKSFTIQFSRNKNSFASPLLTGTTNATMTANKYYVPTKDLPRNTDVFWRVRANGSSGPSAWSEVLQYHTGNPPGIPIPLSPADKAQVSVDWLKIKWKPPTLLAGTVNLYRAQLAGDTDFTNVPFETTQVGTTWDLAAWLMPGHTFYWHVQACNAEQECSAWSTVRSFHTTP
jgi:large repetitive protein